MRKVVREGGGPDCDSHWGNKGLKYCFLGMGEEKCILMTEI